MNQRSARTADPITLIRGATALLGAELEPAVVDLRLQGGRIERIEPSGSAGQAAAGGVLDARGMLAMPGMIDCHDHLRALAPGVGTTGRRLDDMLRATWAMQGHLEPEDYRVAALLGSVQRLKVGVTTIVDHCYPYHREGLDRAALEGYRQSGSRWVYARGIMTKPEELAEPWRVAEGRIRELVASGQVSPEQLFVAPVSLRQASIADYERARGLADDLGCGLYTHVAETTGEREAWQAACGTTPIHALDRLGFLTPRTVLVHCVLLDDDEIELLAERRCQVIHCPTNHMTLAKGVARVPDLLAAGVNVALGVDGASDILAEMRSEMGMQAVARMDPQAVPPHQALAMGTWRGAQALGIGGRAGVLAPGMAADLVLLDASSVLQAPLIDPIQALLHHTHPGLVRHVVVEGRAVVADGRCMTVDEDELRDLAESTSARWLKRAGVGEQPWRIRTAGEKACV